MSVDYQRCLTAGMTAAQAARACGVDVSAARHWAARRGVSWPKNDACVARGLPDGMADLPPLVDCDLDAVACRALWASVLRDQWFWVFGGPLSDDAGHHRREALAWFGTRNCAMVCALAGIEFDYVMLRYRRALRDAAATGAGGAKPPRHKERHRAQGVAA